MKCFTYDQAKEVVAHFEKYLTLSTPEYSLVDLVITPCTEQERSKYMAAYRGKEYPTFNTGRGCDVVVGVKTPDGKMMDKPVREFCKEHGVPYSFPE